MADNYTWLPPAPQTGLIAPGAVAPFTDRTVTQPGNSFTRSSLVKNPTVIQTENALSEAEAAKLNLLKEETQFSEKRDAAALVQAEQEQAEMQAVAARKKEEAARHTAMLEQYRSDEAKQQAEVDRAAGAKGYWEDMPAWRKALSALFMGMGTYAKTDAPMQIYRDAEASDRAKKLQRLDIERQKLVALGKTPEEISANYTARLQQIDRESEANLKLFAKNAEIVGKKIPSQQQAALKIVAEAQEKIAKDRLDREEKYAQRISATQADQTVSERIVDPLSKPGSGPTLQERLSSAGAQNQVSALARLEDILKKHPDEAKAYSQAVKEDIEGQQADKSFLGKGLRPIAKSFGGIPSTLDQRLKSPIQREINQLMTVAISAQAKLADDVGQISDPTFAQAKEALNLSSGSPDDIARSVSMLKKGAEFKLKAAGDVAGNYVETGGRHKMAVPQMVNPATKERPVLSKSDSAMVLHALKNPSDPRAERILRANGREDLLPKLEQLRKQGGK